jgi:hypothetical protein
MYSRALAGASVTVPGPLRTKKSPSGTELGGEDRDAVQEEHEVETASFFVL